jgi:putative oxidoreductase
MNFSKGVSYGVFVLHLTAGLAFLAHSLYLKIFIFTMAGTSKFFESLGLPGIFAWAVMLIEAVTGAMLVFGFKARYAALTSIPILLGATWAHASNGWLFSSTGGGWEYPLFWTLVLLSIAVFGDEVRAGKPNSGSRDNAY